MLSAPWQQCLVDHASSFCVTKLLGQVGLEDCDLRTFDVGQILAIAFLELLDRIATLLDHFVEHRQHGGIIQLNSLVDLDLLDRRKNEAHHFQPVFFTGLHGGLHVLCDLVFEGHG